MRAAVLVKQEQMEVKERKTPEAGTGEVLIRVRSCGICGTDQHIYHGHPGSAEVHPPIVLGHELSGEVVAVGQDVSTLKEGDRVSVDPNIYCGSCEYCRSGRLHLCERLQAVGVTRDGGMAEFCLVPAENCYIIPDAMSYDEAALLEPLGCVLHGFRKLDIRPQHQVLIIGGGFIGQIFLQLVRECGVSRITVSEPASYKHEALRGLGADAVVSPLDPGSADGLASSADVVIECVGRTDSVQSAVRAARKGGQVLLFGVAAPEAEAPIRPFDIFSKELRIMGSFINPFTHTDAIQLVSRGKVRLAPLISHRFTLEQLPDSMRNYPQLGVSKGIVQI
ncbi:2-desacetyl-2-hydroxyethyl bacteriochlorophyllide A dehydrogenase [Paenibacillus rhizosphaerae]|uniref:2-desacetyl-2-hydroxyethyl bacteriochlorophyllide A dehydrogenase n=1 Tax=Paenibacillus rhizosphaerae TaxID=297318 RepID=A0A839TQ18_9BACL|nr:zinc-dependent alcohol dehydrogenase family protein [Paenibacillus rhizosphaerae]MBB3127790.1 2-desacetyl-2-hydroxyethyl bacteriochlorophyllide A dehydrogenase [Paenibacillus rhizosphaerae]